MCLVVLVLLVALGWLLAGGARGQGCTAGRRSISSYMSILALGWLEQHIRILAFVSSLPQVGGVGGGWRMDVVVRASLR